MNDNLMDHAFCVIMAGGKGERFWPLSTDKAPKPFIKLMGGKTLIQLTVERALTMAPKERIFIVLGRLHLDAAREQLPDLEERNFIVEPEGRDTAPCIGNMGSALLVYKDFLKQNYKIVAAFDIDPVKVIGHISEKMGRPVEILHVDILKEVVKARGIEIGIITTPPSEAQKVANLLVDANVKGILNFSPSPVTVPKHVKLRNLFFTSALDNLVYYLSN